MRTLIIGGGAAGLYLAALCPSAVILERNDECGRKLLLTGGGRCTFTQEGSPEELLSHYYGNRQFAKKVLYSHTPDDIVAFFRSLGVAPRNEDGRIFPSDEDAHTVRDALLRKAGKVIKGTAVSIRYLDPGFAITLEEGTILHADIVVIAAGGAHYPHTGSDGSGCRLLASLGHAITEIYPALAPLNLERKLTPAMGISLKAEIRTGKHISSGDILITHNGISGPAVLNISRWVNDSHEVSIRFSDDDIKELRKAFPKKEVRNALAIPQRLSDALLSDISAKKLGSLSRKEELLIQEAIGSFTSKASPVSSAAMSTRGGADTSQFNPMTMESKLISGLYAIGDVLDIDADTGGYSLTFAFASAYQAAMAIR